MITFTMTTCRRLPLFLETMSSFLSTCKDLDMIDRWILVDDHSNPEDLDVIRNTYPDFEIYNSTGVGQAASVNYLLSLVESEWFFYCEDDWRFVRPGNYLRYLFDISQEDSSIKNVTLRNWQGEIKSSKKGCFNYSLHHYESWCRSKEVVDRTNCRWYGYTFNPGIQHLPTIKMLGRYDESHPVDCRRWDREQARRYMLLGYKVANVVYKHIEHIGEGVSIYPD